MLFTVGVLTGSILELDDGIAPVFRVDHSSTAQCNRMRCCDTIQIQNLFRHP